MLRQVQTSIHGTAADPPRSGDAGDPASGRERASQSFRSHMVPGRSDEPLERRPSAAERRSAPETATLATAKATPARRGLPPSAPRQSTSSAGAAQDRNGARKQATSVLGAAPADASARFGDPRGGPQPGVLGLTGTQVSASASESRRSPSNAGVSPSASRSHRSPTSQAAPAADDPPSPAPPPVWLQPWLRPEGAPTGGELAPPRPRPTNLANGESERSARVLLGHGPAGAEARLTLGLGELAGAQIRLQSAGGVVHASFLTAPESARQTLVRTMEEVKRRLQQRGLDLRVTASGSRNAEGARRG